MFMMMAPPPQPPWAMMTPMVMPTMMMPAPPVSMPTATGFPPSSAVPAMLPGASVTTPLECPLRKSAASPKLPHHTPLAHKSSHSLHRQPHRAFSCPILPGGVVSGGNLRAQEQQLKRLSLSTLPAEAVAPCGEVNPVASSEFLDFYFSAGDDCGFRGEEALSVPGCGGTERNGGVRAGGLPTLTELAELSSTMCGRLSPTRTAPDSPNSDGGSDSDRCA